MIERTEKRLGHMRREFHFSLNPYPELRFSSCPDCRGKTGQRTLPLLIFVHPMHLIDMNYKNRYCGACNMLIGHKHEIEHFLTEEFKKHTPSTIGNEYTFIGNVDKKAWRKGLQKIKDWDVLKYTHDFKSYQELRMTAAGWFRGEAPVMVPPPSEKWIKG